MFNKLLKHIWFVVKNHKKHLNIFTLLFINKGVFLMLNTPSFIITGTMNLIQSLLSRYTGLLKKNLPRWAIQFFRSVYFYRYLLLTVYIRDRCPACGFQIHPNQNKVFAFFGEVMITSTKIYCLLYIEYYPFQTSCKLCCEIINY